MQFVERKNTPTSLWTRILLSGKLGGYVNIAVGILLIALLFAPYLGYKLGFIELSDQGSSIREEVRQPPSIKILAKWLDHRKDQDIQTSNPFSAFNPTKAETLVKTHFLGTDSAGRDLLHMVFLAADKAFLPGIYSVFLTLGLGCLFGILWGYYGGWRGIVVSTVIKIVHSIPRLFLLLVIGAASNFDIYWIMTGLGIVNFPKIAQLISAKILSLKRQEFITAAREIGMRDFTILLKHILWYNCRHILFIQATFGMADAVLAEATLAYLGFGAQGISWGGMVASGKNYIFDGMFWLSAIPAFSVLFVILGFCLLGDGLSRIYKLKA